MQKQAEEKAAAAMKAGDDFRTEFAKQETALNAALATFPKVSNLSLFNYI